MRFLVIILLLVISFMVSSCNGNKLKTNEKTLKNQIFTEEQQLAQEDFLRTEREKQLADSIAKLSKGFQFKEYRAVEEQLPPIHIDIEEGMNSVRDFTLSDFIADINIIPLDTFPYRENVACPFSLSQSDIILSGMGYLWRYDRSGNLIDEVCTAQRTGNGYKGHWGNIYILDNKLYYRFADNMEKRYYWMQYDLDAPDNVLTFPDETGNYPISGKGEKLADLPVNKEERFHDVFPIGQDLKIGIKDKWQSALHGIMLVTLSKSDDKLVSFNDYDLLQNFSNTIFRNDFTQITYLYNNTFTFSGAFNDTVYRLVPPNRLFPAFIISMDPKHKISIREGFSPSGDISQKLYLYRWLETVKRIYMVIRKGYGETDSEFYYFIYNKKTDDLFLVNSQALFGLIRRVVAFSETDDPGKHIPPFWPANVSANHEICYLTTGKILTRLMTSKELQGTGLGSKKISKLKEKASHIKENQHVIITVQEK